MDFYTQYLKSHEISEDQIDLLKSFQEYLDKYLIPLRGEGFKPEYQGGKVIFSSEFKASLEEFHRLGFFHLGQEENYGGMAVSEPFLIAMTSLMTKAHLSWSLFPALTRSAIRLLKAYGSEELKKEYLPLMIEGKASGTMCLTESQAGSDLSEIKTKATYKDGSYKIEGQKIFISGGDHNLYDNIIHFVLAKTPEGLKKEGTKGISLFLVPKFLKGQSNFIHCAKLEHKMGLAHSPTCELVFSHQGETKGFLIGEEFQGLKQMFLMMNEARIYCAVQGEGIAACALELAQKYAQERIQFKKPIKEHDDVKYHLQKIESMVTAMRLWLLKTASLLEDKNKKSLLDFLTPLLKAFCTEQGFLLSSDALQIFGGYGYMEEYPIAQVLRDSRIAMIYEGTNGIQAHDFITRKLIYNQGELFYLFKKEFHQESLKESFEVGEMILKKYLTTQDLSSSLDALRYFSYLALGSLMHKDAFFMRYHFSETASLSKKILG